MPSLFPCLPLRATGLARAAGLSLALALPDTPTAHAQEGVPAPLPPVIAQALSEQGLPASALSIWVQEVDSASPRLSHLARVPRRTASVMKLVTTGVALRALGPAYAWHTSAAFTGRVDPRGVLHGDVLVRASGDPSLDHVRLLAGLRAWRQAGLREIRGDVVVDRGIFALPQHDAAAFDGEPLRPYNAVPDAWLLAHQAVSLRLAPDLARPGQVHISMMPPLQGVTLEAGVSADSRTSCGAWRQDLSVEVLSAPGDRQRLRLGGRYPLACGEQWWPLRWPQAADGEHSARLFMAAWQEVGGRLTGKVRDGPWPEDPGITPLPGWRSPPLAEVVRDINKFSNNVMARQVFLTLAAPSHGSGPATLERAREVVAAHVRQATAATGASGTPTSACEGDGLAVDNGSGLSRTEEASVACLGRWVQVMWQDPTMPEWLASLPVAGVDGTARRMTQAVGRAHLKTGSIEGVASVAGVVQDDAGRRHVVVAIINDPRAAQARSVLQAVVGWAAASGP